VLTKQLEALTVILAATAAVNTNFSSYKFVLSVLQLQLK
jgi:hypothetical protein